MNDYQPTMTLTQEDITGAALHRLSGFDYLYSTEVADSRLYLRLVESSGAPTVLEVGLPLDAKAFETEENFDLNKR